MHNEPMATRWIAVCSQDDIVPNTGVCALVGGEQIAVFYIAASVTTDVAGTPSTAGPRYFAIGNYDPNADASVLSRGLVGNLGQRIVVASPIYKHHFDLSTGECLECPEHSVAAYATRIGDGKVWIAA